LPLARGEQASTTPLSSWNDLGSLAAVVAEYRPDNERAVAIGISDARSRESADEILSTAASSQSIQESEECVWRAAAAGFAVQWLGAGECWFFEREVGVEVHLRGFDLFVSEPERDHGGADPGVK
jgi:hypothetical protein